MLKPSRFRSFTVHDVCSCTVPFNKNIKLFFVQNKESHLKRALVGFPGGTTLGGFLMSDQLKTQHQLARLVVIKE